LRMPPRSHWLIPGVHDAPSMPGASVNALGSDTQRHANDAESHSGRSIAAQRPCARTGTFSQYWARQVLGKCPPALFTLCRAVWLLAFGLWPLAMADAVDRAGDDRKSGIAVTVLGNRGVEAVVYHFAGLPQAEENRLRPGSAARPASDIAREGSRRGLSSLRSQAEEPALNWRFSHYSAGRASIPSIRDSTQSAITRQS
jgi:hypothetical protein